MNLKSGDKIKFGNVYCKKENRPELKGKTVILTPQLFDEDNGLYCYESECPGIWNEQDNEADSIYHLFGNRLDRFYDCELIPATEEDLQEIKNMREAREKAIADEYSRMADYFLN